MLLVINSVFCLRREPNYLERKRERNSRIIFFLAGNIAKKKKEKRKKNLQYIFNTASNAYSNARSDLPSLNATYHQYSLPYSDMESFAVDTLVFGERLVIDLHGLFYFGDNFFLTASSKIGRVFAIDGKRRRAHWQTRIIKLINFMNYTI